MTGKASALQVSLFRKNKKLATLLGIFAVLTLTLVYLLNIDDVSHNGRLYTSKSALCSEFVRSYLRTIQKTEKDFNERKWEMAIDIETDFYNMCLLDLNPKALGDYRAAALEKYSK